MLPNTVPDHVLARLVHIATARSNQRIIHQEELFEVETREEIQLAAVQAALQAMRDRMV